MFRSVRRYLTSNVATTPKSTALTSPKQDSIIEADIVSGVPLEVSTRTVRIYRPAKTNMQSGVEGTKKWRIDFDVQQKWENELMGWSSSADTVQALRIKFNTKEDAILFAQKQGYKYYVQEPKEVQFKVKTYAQNFKYNPGKLTWIHTKVLLFLI